MVDFAVVVYRVSRVGEDHVGITRTAVHDIASGTIADIDIVVTLSGRDGVAAGPPKAEDVIVSGVAGDGVVTRT